MKPDIRRKGLLTTVDYGPHHKKVTYRRKQPSVHVREGNRIIKTIHFQPLRKRLAYKLRRAYRKTLYTLKFAFLVSIPTSIVVIIIIGAIDTGSVKYSPKRFQGRPVRVTIEEVIEEPVGKKSRGKPPNTHQSKNAPVNEVEVETSGDV